MSNRVILILSLILTTFFLVFAYVYIARIPASDVNENSSTTSNKIQSTSSKTISSQPTSAEEKMKLLDTLNESASSNEDEGSIEIEKSKMNILSNLKNDVNAASSSKSATSNTTSSLTEDEKSRILNAL